MNFQIIACLMVISIIQVCRSTYDDEKRLYDDLLTDYRTSIRPSGNGKSPIEVEFQMEILKLRSYDLKEQVLTITAFTMMHWKDPQLSWNATDYGGRDRMNFDSNEIWTPDIVLYKSAYDERETWKETFPSKTIVLSNGHVIWNMPVIWYAVCQSDITWFPLDQQTCQMQFGSWSYSKSQLRIVPWKRDNFEDGHKITPNGQWEIKSVTASYSNASFRCCPEAFSVMRYTIVFDHLSSFYFIYIILPMTALCLMFPLIFIIPVDSGERLGYGTTVILSITVYLLAISDKLPEKSDAKPALGITFVGEFFILCFGLMIATLSMTIYSKKKAGPPLLRRLARVTAKQQNTGKVEYPMAERDNDGYKSDTNAKSGSPSKANKKSCLSHGLNERRPAEIRKYKEEWEILASFLDCFGFFFTYAMILFFPLFVYLALPKTGLQ